MTSVLIVDDSPDDMEFLADLICRDHPEFVVESAETGSAGLQKLAEFRPDCVLLDYRLGHENGLDLLPQFLEKGKGTSVIMLTGQGSEPIAAASIKAGASDYLVKQDATGTALRTAVRNAVERASMQRRLKAQEQDLRRQGRLEALGQLSAGIAHDFNNMLATIRFGVEGVKRNPNSSGNAQKLDMIITTVDRAAERTQGLLAFASKQVGRMSSHPCSEVFFELEALVRDLISDDCRIEFHFCEPDVAIYCDHSLLQNALLNLVVNARDAIKGYRRDGMIEVSASLEDGEELAGKGRLMLTVSDNGKGIPEEIIDRVTDPYFTTKQDAGGTGIGLAMVHGFVTQSEGLLEVQSKPNEGTTISFTIPVGEGEDAGAAEAVKSRHPTTAAGRHVLLIDDEDLLAGMIRDLLEEVGFVVHKAATPDEALALLDNLQESDAVVTDISLRGSLDGFDLAAIIRGRLPKIQIIGISGFHEFEEGRKRDVMDAFLTKPFQAADLISELYNFGTGV